METTILSISYPKITSATAGVLLAQPDLAPFTSPDTNDNRPFGTSLSAGRSGAHARITIKYRKNGGPHAGKTAFRPCPIDALPFESDDREAALHKWLRAKGLL